MAIKLPKLLAGTDAKSRVFLVFASIAAATLLIFAAVHYLGGGSTTGGGSKVASAPASLQTVPGGQMSPEFYRAVVQANTQAAKQAQISGGSALPTLVNVPGQQAGFPSDSCTIMCPSEDNPNVADDINSLVKQGKLTQEEANHLLDLAKNNVPVDEYAAALNDLVRQGKLTPEQARSLLAKYRKQHDNALLTESGTLMDSMIKSGQLPLDVANQLLALQKSNVSPADYATELNRLVREGKISPETAAKLLAQYTQQQMREQAKEGAFTLQQMAKSGEITPDVAKTLTDLQNKNVSVDDYAAALNRLVAAGKMTPATAAKLLEAYKKQRTALGTTGTLSSMLGQAQGDAAALLNDMVKSGKLTQDEANAILALEKDAHTAQDCQVGLNKFFQTNKKLSLDDQKRMMAGCEKLAAVNAEAEKLAALQANNATIGQYTDELKRAVAAGLISPELAQQLLSQYQALTAPVAVPGAGIVPGIEANIPGAAEFARLQQNIQAGAAAAPAAPAAQFVAPTPAQAQQAQAQQQPQAAQGETDQERQQRLDAMRTAMSGQAQQLIAAWQPVPMTHKEGSPEKPKSGISGGGSGGSQGGGSSASKTPAPIIIKAGSILFAVLDTAVDSDYPDTPVMATIVQGEHKGAKLLGKLNLAQGMDKVSLNFQTMNEDVWPNSQSVSAYAIDPDTARTVMASSVDYHYMKRFGAIMATSFLSGYSNAIMTEGSNTTTGIFGTSTSHPALSPGNKIAAGLGQIGTTLSSQMSSYINTPTTVKVNSGVGLGILFMQDVTLPSAATPPLTASTTTMPTTVTSEAASTTNKQNAQSKL